MDARIAHECRGEKEARMDARIDARIAHESRTSKFQCKTHEAFPQKWAHERNGKMKGYRFGHHFGHHFGAHFCHHIHAQSKWTRGQVDAIMVLT